MGGKTASRGAACLHERLPGQPATTGNRLKGISKISVQTGTARASSFRMGASPGCAGFRVLRNLSQIARTQYGLGGAVQHGASTLPDEAFTSS